MTDSQVAPTRKPISKRVRFEVFKRDGFCCQYCGKHPPDVTLEIDHIVAVAEGGGSEEENLLTACFNCNRGKGATPLTVIPKSLADKAAEIAEREDQIAGYRAIVQARIDRIESDAWEVVAVLLPLPKGEERLTCRRDWLLSIKKFLERLDLHELLEAAEIAMAKKPFHETTRLKYFFGVCWTKIKRMDGIANG